MQEPRQTLSSQPQDQHQVASIPITAQIFLFRQLVNDILNHCKKNIKAPPFDEMIVDKLVDTNYTRSIDIYQQYFLVGIGTVKTREYVCGRYERLIRENLVNKDSLPPQMVTGIINARSAVGGGSTASSGSNSGVGSAMNISTDKSIQIGKLITAILSLTLQPSSEIIAGLQYLLQGTRNKSNGNQFALLIEDSYKSLSKFRKRPMQRFLDHFLHNIVNQVQYHEAPYFEYQKKYLSQFRKQKQPQPQSFNKYKQAPQLIQSQQSQAQPSLPQPPPIHNFIRSSSSTLKQRLCNHSDQDAKYGKCFICQRSANNCDKNMYVPLCGMECKLKLKRINQEIIINDHFCMLKWILEGLGGPGLGSVGEEVLYGLLMRDIAEGGDIGEVQVGIILELIVGNFGLHNIGIVNGVQTIQNINPPTTNKVIQTSSIILSYLIKKHTHLMLRPSPTTPTASPIRPCFPTTKVILLQYIRLLQSLPILNNPLQLTLLRSLIDIISTKQMPVSQNSYIVMKQLFLYCDCQILESNLVERAFNVFSQYALFNGGGSGQSGGAGGIGSSVSLQNLGTNTSIGSDGGSNSMGMGVINSNVSLSNSSCVETSISGLDQMLSSLVKIMKQYSNLHSDNPLPQIVQQKKTKKYLQSKFIQQFNKKPIKAVEQLRKLFDDKITAKDIAIILRQNIDYQTRIKKSFQRINKQEVGTYFGTLKKDKNGIKDDYNQKIYWEFLKLLESQFVGREIDDCLRVAFNAFLMPKEGQQVQVVLGPLSLALEPFLGLKLGNQATATYQLIMVSLMVQTSNNPNVKQNQKIKYDGFKKFCSEIDENLSEQRMEIIYDRIKKRPLELLMQYKGIDVFTKKYVHHQHLQTDFWRYIQNIAAIQEKKQGNDSPSKANQTSLAMKKSQLGSKKSLIYESSTVAEQKKEKSAKSQIIAVVEMKKQQQTVIKQVQISSQTSPRKIQSKSSISLDQADPSPGQPHKNFLSFSLQTLWQYIYISLVNRYNLRGLQQCCILYGNSELQTQFDVFFNHLYKIHTELQQRSSSTLQNISNQAKLIILRLAIDYCNCVIGRNAWLVVIKIVYRLDGDREAKQGGNKKGDSLYAGYQYQASDKLFTRSNQFQPVRLKQFLQAMCQFSSSQVKTDKNYTRQMYILHHIAQIIEYNLQRFQHKPQNQQVCCLDVWQTVWPTIRSYFQNICVHPRKQISMSAIDSYKQLTMKILKLPHLKNPTQTHTQLMSVYLDIFERSPSYIKDLIINILLNVVCPQMKAGWSELYTMLEIVDSGDPAVVMKVVGRILRDVGLPGVGGLMRLLQIVVKELRIANQDQAVYGPIMDALWEICQYFNRLDVWLETMSKVKDIFKSSTHVTVLRFFYRLCNKCIQLTRFRSRRKSEQRNQLLERQIQSSQILSPVKRKLSQMPIQNIEQFEELEQQLQKEHLKEAMEEQEQKEEMKKVSLNTKATEMNAKRNEKQKIIPEQAHKLIYFEIFSAQMHILQIRNVKLFSLCLNLFKQLDLDVFFRNMGNNEQDNKTGFLILWQMFLSCPHSLIFCYFLHEYLAIVFNKLALYRQRLLKTNTQTNARGCDSSDCIKTFEHLVIVKKQILLWITRLMVDAGKEQILSLCQEDMDLSKTFDQVLQQRVYSTTKTQLIQFYLSSKQYEIKSTQQLILLKIIKTYFESTASSHITYAYTSAYTYTYTQQQQNKVQKQINSLASIRQTILDIILDYYTTAQAVNQKPLLRNFLWNNDFFKGANYLPGLFKQQFRAFEIVVKYYGVNEKKGRIYDTITAFIRRFMQKSKMVSNKPNIASPPPSSKPTIMAVSQAHQIQQSQLLQSLVQDMQLYLTNSEQLVSTSLQKLRREIKQYRAQAQTSTQKQKQKQEQKWRSGNINNMQVYKQLFDLCIQLAKCTASKGLLRDAAELLALLVDSIY